MAASQPPAQPVNSWVYSVRTSMVDDPAKQWFDSQVQSHGFDFLDDYLDNILAQAKSQPIIELVKTPNRKNIKKKAHVVAAGSKLKSTISISLDDSDDQGKENVAPINIFHRNLLNIKPNDVAATHNVERDFCYNQPPIPQDKDQDTTGYDPQPEHSETVSSDRSIPNSSTKDSLKPAMPHPQLKDLSVIAEGDEFAEQSSRSAQPIARVNGKAQRLSVPVDHGQDTMDENPTSVTAVTTTSTHTYHTALSELSGGQSDNETQRSEGPAIVLAVPQPSDTVTSETQSKAVPPPSVQQPTRTPFKLSIPLHEIPGTRLMHKSSAPQLQTFPVVSREPSGSSVAPTAVLQKRTSWLVKAREAREAKAIESNKSTSIFGQAGPITDQTSLSTPSDAGRTKRKSSEMLEAVMAEETVSRPSKMPKVVDDDVSSNALRDREPLVNDIRSLPSIDADHTDVMLNTFKRTIEGFGNRAGKSTGKSLGGTAAAALAEARATAEARLAEKIKLESGTESPSLLTKELERVVVAQDVVETIDPRPIPTQSRDSDKRLSVSELITSRESSKGKERVFQPPSKPSLAKQPRDAEVPANSDMSIVTEPVSSPKSHESKPSLPLLSKPVFMKPPPKVFVPPQPKTTSPKMAATNVGLSPSLQRLTAPLSTQPSVASIKSNAVFNQDSSSPMWMPTIQDTDYMTGVDYETHTQDQEMRGINYMDDDDSWHDADTLGELNHIWSALEPTDKEDEMTWSTIPTQSQTSTQNRTNSNNLFSSQVVGDTGSKVGVQSPTESGGNVVEDFNIAREMVMDIDTEFEDIELEPGQMTIGLVKKQTESGSRSSFNERSVASSESSQGGIFHQASKFVSNVLGTSKKGKTPDPVKSLQLAAAAAKKQKEDEDKKAARVKEMEIRRQQVAEKKAEEDRARIFEEEKKMKDDACRKKKEQEELIERKALKASTSKKAVDEQLKKVKTELKAGPSSQETKEQPARVTSAAAKDPLPKPILKSSVEPPTVSKPTGDSRSAKAIKIATPAKGKAKAVVDDPDDAPSRIIQGNMVARAKAQMKPSPPVKSESIQLPEIDSEYSDSEDEDRKKNFNPPEWAQSPNLTHALEDLSRVNPDSIFGAVQPLHIEDMFKTRHSRFRARTSSANWAGTDGLRPGEEEEYARRMGFRTD